jgi:type I restriction enzyme M protein
MAEDQLNNHASLIWSVADLLRGDYKQSDYGKVILPLTVLRRLDCVLEETKEAVLKRASALEGRVKNPDAVLENEAGHGFYNTSPLNFRRIVATPGQVKGSLEEYIACFSPGARDAFEKFDFNVQIGRLDRADLLYRVISRFAEVDLSPAKVSNLEMGYIYEELIRRFSELSNETAGHHFTPREVIRLMVNLLFANDDEALAGAAIKTLYDPACGTGGMLSVAEEYLREHNRRARLEVYGQEVNPETYAVCRTDMMLKDENASNIMCGNSFSEDGQPATKFDYMLANPPFGVEWKKVEDEVRGEHESRGFAGRFGAGLPRINDGSFLFLQHMLSKMKPIEEGGSRLAIVFNGSPLFSGGAGSGESEIRRWIIENDWLEAVVALPDQLFYNTGISTYFWVLTNRKRPERQGKIQLVDARESWVKMRKSLGDKRKQISPEQIEEITQLYAEFNESDRVKIFPNEAFGYQRVTVERPLRLRWEVTEGTVQRVAETKQWARLTDEERKDLSARLSELVGTSTTDRTEMSDKLGELPKAIQKQAWDALAVKDPDAPIITDRDGEPLSDPELRDYENMPLPVIPVLWEVDPTDRLASLEYGSEVEDYMAAEVLPYTKDAWVDHNKTKIGYEIPLTRHFHKLSSPRPLSIIDSEISALEIEAQQLLAEITT